VKQKDFERFCSLAYDKAGIRLRDGKEALVSARVSKRMRALDLRDFSDYLEVLDTDENELIHFLDAISTNYTSFFREREHFNLLTEHVRQWIDRGRQRLRIWSAASSSGEEPYSLAITMAEALNGRELDYRILATDISLSVLQRGQEGVYSSAALTNVPPEWRGKYFRRLRAARDDNEKSPQYAVKDELRQRIVFRHMNLNEVPYPLRGPLDAVFCRNVMIYFDKDVRQRLISEFERLLRPGGLLIVGHTETLTGIRHRFSTVKPSVYRMPELP